MLSVKTLFLISYLRGVALDLNGAVYVADDELHCVVSKCFFFFFISNPKIFKHRNTSEGADTTLDSLSKHLCFSVVEFCTVQRHQ